MRKKRNQSNQGSPDTAAFPEPKRLTPVDIQQKEFRLAVRGYNEREVDQFLDEMTEELARLYAENKRLREDLDIARRSERGDPESAEAASLVRSAREEATRILSEARARITAMAMQTREGASPPAAAPPVGSGLVGTFLAREREFLQGMAGLIQRHAEAVKEDVRRARVAATASSRGAHAATLEPPGSGEAADRQEDETPEPEPGPPAAASSPMPETSTGDQASPAVAEPNAAEGPSVLQAPETPETPESPETLPVPEVVESPEPIGPPEVPRTPEAREALEVPGVPEVPDVPAGQEARGAEGTMETEPPDTAVAQDVVDLTADAPEPPLTPATEHETEKEGQGEAAPQPLTVFATRLAASFETGGPPSPPARMEPGADEDESGSERSLRELFWGED